MTTVKGDDVVISGEAVSGTGLKRALFDALEAEFGYIPIPYPTVGALKSEAATDIFGQPTGRYTQEDVDRLTPVIADVREKSRRTLGNLCNKVVDTLIPAASLGIYTFGANFTVAGRFAGAAAPASTTESASALTIGYHHVVVRGGVITTVSWATANAKANTVFKVWVNGVVAASLSSASSPSAFVTDLEIEVPEGALLALEFDAGNVPGLSLFHVGVESA